MIPSLIKQKLHFFTWSFVIHTCLVLYICRCKEMDERVILFSLHLLYVVGEQKFNTFQCSICLLSSFFRFYYQKLTDLFCLSWFSFFLYVGELVEPLVLKVQVRKFEPLGSLIFFFVDLIKIFFRVGDKNKRVSVYILIIIKQQYH